MCCKMISWFTLLTSMERHQNSHHSLMKLPWTTEHEEADSKKICVCWISGESSWFWSSNVAVIACYQYAANLSWLSKFSFKSGVGSKRRYVVIHETAEVFGSTVRKILTVFHCITRCDSVSSLSWIGKNQHLLSWKKM